MRVIAKSKLREYGERHGQDAYEQLMAWHQEAEAADWSCPQDIKNQYPQASFIGKEVVIFNICGGRYRFAVNVVYAVNVVFITWFGDHNKYDRTDFEAFNVD